MKQRKIVKLLVAMFTILVLFANSIIVYAANTKTELNSKMGDVDEQIKETKNEINEVKTEMSDKMKEVQKLTNEISSYQDEIDTLDAQIKELQESISEQEEELNKAEEDFKKQNELLQKRLIALYEAGQTSYIDVLLNAEDITDFLSRYYIISEIADSDAKLLQKIEDDKNSIQAKKESLESSKQKIEENKASKVKASKALESKQTAKNKEVKELSAQEKQLQNELEQFEKDKREIQAQLKKIAEQEAKNNKTNVTSNPSSAGYIRPINGYSITTGMYYSNGSYHGAVDFSGSGIAGKPIYAVKDGTVVISTALKYSNGNYKSYGEYIVINHHDGTMTLYAHGAPGSRLVSENQTVKQGQQIMSVGTTGNSTGYHLHFEVRVNGVRVDPRPYLP